LIFFVGNTRPLWAGRNGVLAQSAQAYDNEHQYTSMKINPCPHGHLDILREACICVRMVQIISCQRSLHTASRMPEATSPIMLITLRQPLMFIDVLCWQYPPVTGGA
jgi:hypothetical protein